MKTAVPAGQPVPAIEALPYVRAIAPYLAGKPIEELAREHGLDPEKIVKLASNENPLGMPESARMAIEAALAELGRYPDSNGFELKAALSRKLDVPAEWITLGNGSNDILEGAAAVMLAPGRSCVYAQHSFAVYPLATQAAGATGITVPARRFGHDLDAMRAAIRPDTRVVFIANPNNPTGTLLAAPELHEFLSAVPPTVLVVLDEAYSEYLPEPDKAPSIAWLTEFPNLVVTRTFSKAYGLAGLRVGFALSNSAVADLMNRVRQPFNVNSLSLTAAAAALFDDEFVRRSYEVNAAGLRQVTAALDRLGLEHIPTHANFVTFRVGDGAAVYRRLLERGVIVRPIAGYGMPEWLRVSIGLESENARFIEALAKAVPR